MRKRLRVLPVVSSLLLLGIFAAACSGSNTALGPTGGAGTPGTAGNTSTAGATNTAGSIGTAGANGNGGSAVTAGASGASGGTGMSGSAGTGGASGGASTRTVGCGMDPQPSDSATAWIKHDVEVTGVDPAFITMYPPNAGTTYNWTHRNYFLRLPTDYDNRKSYPVTIGTSGCGGPETVGAEGGYSPLGVAQGETKAIQVSLSYVLSSAANADCGGAVFADDFVNSPEPQYLAAVVKDVQAKYCTDSKKVFLSGYSSGAFETITLGCANSDILRGTGVQIGGGLRQHAPMPCKGPVAAMFVVGLQDNENPIGPLTTALHDSLGTAPARDEVLADTAHALVAIDLLADLPIGNADRTVEFWMYVKPTDWVAERNEIYVYGTVGKLQQVGLDFGLPAVQGMPNNHASLGPYTDGVYDDDTGVYLGIDSTASQWLHVAMTWDGANTTLRTYVNGALRITTKSPSSTPLITTASPFYLGCNPPYYGCFNGLVGRVPRSWARTRKRSWATNLG
jgi:Concanavalin A-like lectin/glucanases superfamily